MFYLHIPFINIHNSPTSLSYPPGSSSHLPYLRDNTPSPLTGYFPYIGEELGYSVRKAYAETSASKAFLTPPLR